MFQSAQRPKGFIRPVQKGVDWQVEDEIGLLAFAETELVLPSQQWAEAIVHEWPQKQKSASDQHRESLTQRDVIHIKPNRPASQVAQLALLGTVQDPSQYHQQLLNFLPTDTLLFWQQSPTSLMQAQIHHWQPILNWVEQQFGDRPEARYDLTPADVSVALRQNIENWLKGCSSYQLAGLIFITGITGSIFLSVALAAQAINAETAYKAASLEAIYQRDKWGADAEGDARLDRVQQSCILAEIFLHL